MLVSILRRACACALALTTLAAPARAEEIQLEHINAAALIYTRAVETALNACLVQIDPTLASASETATAIDQNLAGLLDGDAGIGLLPLFDADLRAQVTALAALRTSDAATFIAASHDLVETLVTRPHDNAQDVHWVMTAAQYLADTQMLMTNLCEAARNGTLIDAAQIAREQTTLTNTASALVNGDPLSDLPPPASPQIELRAKMALSFWNSFLNEMIFSYATGSVSSGTIIAIAPSLDSLVNSFHDIIGTYNSV
ncbi:hypothetical protein AQS8620_02734 [Aquimixticola soesokkakensis]|uniref:NarX-like N-terminal domain-containing protein n=1 Tax=Aquimixticola soesokkakensis TaxID=1519096 RepID=A0A1Y5THM4_9RHOB|nr:hypothetical protein [Aquimixticola soesokkakensis]SLN60559.1 hypothetical protein AQS8620_02734 [Aquimixticola soesokkakensis]